MAKASLETRLHTESNLVPVIRLRGKPSAQLIGGGEREASGRHAATEF
jgi:hypothetical protein